jgi:hypothetical protein
MDILDSGNGNEFKLIRLNQIMISVYTHWFYFIRCKIKVYACIILYDLHAQKLSSSQVSQNIINIETT